MSPNISFIFVGLEVSLGIISN